ncbi:MULTISPECIES: nitronate monooxygenase [unclassified Mycobacterium]|uniref:NAD(P)H-dependent flavin oxidoreductase n=1 Tax=unclassified Mycobacterium TaxID=2642494 RepID=UPI0029C7E5E4|nr:MULTISPECIES: nitronate monooxygenase [unclassified Mycobacterium]
MTTLSTDWSRAMGLDAPILNAPMGGVAGGALAAAVSRAGGLGMVGIGSAGTSLDLERQLRYLSELGRPFGIGLVEWVTRCEPDLLAAAIAAKPAMLCVSFGDDFSWVQRAHDAGIVAATQIGDLRGAARAVDAGVDVVIARGAEAGGHGMPSVGTLPLLAAILDELSVPVLAAGGISSGRALAAVLAAGASGAWLGTAFCACTETLSSDETRRALLPAEDTDTVTTRVFDIALGYPWPKSIPERVLRNEFTDRWHGHEHELSANGDASAALHTAIAEGDHRQAPINAGHGVGMLRTVRPAAEVIDRLCTDASRLLGRRYIP